MIDCESLADELEQRRQIRLTIRNYLKGSTTISAHTLKCFIGMIETGEATLADFEFVGGVAVRQLVRENLES